MTDRTPDQLVIIDDWSDLVGSREMPEIDQERMHRYRLGRLLAEMHRRDVSLCVLVNPISLRYAIDYRNYALFNAHIPCTYLVLNREGHYVLHNAFEPNLPEQNRSSGRPISYFYGGENLETFASEFALDIDRYLTEYGDGNRRVAVEYVNPSITLALNRREIDVVDGVSVSERARLVKSADEIACIRWAMVVAELGAAKVKEALRPGVTEIQLWGLLNYTNLANNGDWHDGRMMASGPRINPWLQEASDRKLEAGDLLGFDTDMIGPRGYFADLSRTYFCGPGSPTRRQKALYRLAMEEVEHNLSLVRPGVRFSEIQEKAYPVPEEFQENAYPCLIHGVGMCDEYPHLNPLFREPLPYDDVLVPGMVLCIESYMGAVGERDGVKLEQQVLVTETGYDLITQYPFDDAFL